MTEGCVGCSTPPRAESSTLPKHIRTEAVLVGDASWKGAVTDTPLGKGLLRIRLLEIGCYEGGCQTLGEFGYGDGRMHAVS